MENEQNVEVQPSENSLQAIQSFKQETYESFRAIDDGFQKASFKIRASEQNAGNPMAFAELLITDRLVPIYKDKLNNFEG